MLLDIGDVYGPNQGFEIFIYDDDGDLAAATVAVTITLPDGATTTPSVTTPSTGRYQASYKPTQAGTHYVQWVATSVGGVSGADTAEETTFTVSASNNTFLSLDEGRSALRLQDTSDDAELLGYIEVACELAEIVADTTFTRTTQVDTISVRTCTGRVWLTKRPVLSVTSVVENGVTLSASDYRVDGGSLKRKSGSYALASWPPGEDNVVVTYATGYTVIPPSVREATRSILKHLWTTQRDRPGSQRPSTRDDYPVPGTNWFIPNKAKDILFDLRQPLVG